MKKTHWKKLDNPNYLGAYSLLDGETTEVTATIQKVVTETVKTSRGDDDCKVMYLKGIKPMILNATNSKTIEALYGTPFIEDWVGKRVIIYVANERIKGEQIDCLRIKNYKPEAVEKKEILPDSKEWNAALEKKVPLEKVKQFYKITNLNAKEYQTKLI